MATSTSPSPLHDVILIGSGIMSATLGAMLKRIDPAASIQLYEVGSSLAPEASAGINNAGTGHAGICEMSYTPEYGPDGEVDVTTPIDIFQQFELSRQFWGYAVREGMIDDPGRFIQGVPHLSFVYGQPQVDFLRSRHRQMSAHHFFKSMRYTEDREVIKKWAPLMLDGRDPMEPVAMTRMESGSDVNFGRLASLLIEWLGQQPDCGFAVQHRVIDLTEVPEGWRVKVRNQKTGEVFEQRAKFVFVGAGGGSLPLLQKSGIPEAKGFGGFPIGGQWLVCDTPEVVAQHQAKVYGMSPGAAPTMAVPHLDTRIIDGKKSLMFGPYAAWTTKFLHEGGRLTDLPGSIRPGNIGSLIKVGLHNIPLVQYLVQQGTQSMETRLKELRNFYPAAKKEDWKLIDAGIRVQAIKKEDGDAGIVHFGTEVVTNAQGSLSALLGASPGASVSTHIITEVIARCFGEWLKDDAKRERMSAMVPTFGKDIRQPEMAELQQKFHVQAAESLGLAID